MAENNRGLLADLAKERMEREMKRRRVDEPENSAQQQETVVRSSQADENGSKPPSVPSENDVVELSDRPESKGKHAIPPKSDDPGPSKPDEVVLLSDDEEDVVTSDNTAPSHAAVWSCEVCTLNNSMDAEHCDACDTPRPAQSATRASSQDGDNIVETAPKKSDKKAWELKVLTYNCWFEISVCLRERMAAIGDIIQKEQPDVIMMQEVVPEMEHLFRSAEWYKQYHPSRRPQGMAYYTLLYVHKSAEILSESDRHEFGNSQMGRDLLSVCIKVRGQELVVATSHLESLTEFKAGAAKEAQLAARKEQLASAQKRLEVFGKRIEGATGNAPQIIYAGDMNWNDQETGAPQLQAGWADPWPQLNPRDPGYTYDGPRNCMLVNKFRNRLDRFFCRLAGGVRASSMKMVGLEPIEGAEYERSVYGKPKTLPVSPSDHFGLLATFQNEEAAAEEEAGACERTGTGRPGAATAAVEAAPGKRSIRDFFKKK